MEQLTILAISGSLRKRSSNTAVLQAAAGFVPAGFHFVNFEGIGDLPHFNPETEESAVPESVHTFRNALKDADAVLICTPEYANGVPGVLKNALDWVVGTGEFWHMPVATISASPAATGGENAHTSLRLTLGIMDANLVEGAMLRIPTVSKKIDASGALIDPETRAALKTVMEKLCAAAGRPTRV